jgi:hypothetical protein
MPLWEGKKHISLAKVSVDLQAQPQISVLLEAGKEVVQLPRPNHLFHLLRITGHALLVRIFVVQDAQTQLLLFPRLRHRRVMNSLARTHPDVLLGDVRVRINEPQISVLLMDICGQIVLRQERVMAGCPLKLANSGTPLHGTRCLANLRPTIPKEPPTVSPHLARIVVRNSWTHLCSRTRAEQTTTYHTRR